MPENSENGSDNTKGSNGKDNMPTTNNEKNDEQQNNSSNTGDDNGFPIESGSEDTSNNGRNEGNESGATGGETKYVDSEDEDPVYVDSGDGDPGDEDPVDITPGDEDPVYETPGDEEIVDNGADESLEKGDYIETSKAVYSVLKNYGEKEVAFCELHNSNAKTASIPKKITYDGVTYKVTAIED